MVGGSPSTTMAAPAFDAATALAAFAADVDKRSLELPPMSAGQRRQVKQLVEQYPELQCESYGFGAERQLHLFKPLHGGASSDTVATSSEACDEPAAGLQLPSPPGLHLVVRNTFIDGWLGSEEDDENAEHVIFRSMPPQLRQKASTDMSLAEAAKLSHEEDACRAIPHWCERVSSDTHSTTASSASRSSSPSPGVPVARQPATGGQDSGNVGLQVRNTFVHFEEPAPADPRAVQSMPHGMFGKCLAEEEALKSTEVPAAPAAPEPKDVDPVASQAAAVAPPAQPVPSSLQPNPESFIGAEVLVTGLVKAPAFNGQRGVIHSWDPAVGRYNVLLQLRAGPQWAKVKWENLASVARSVAR